MADFIYYVQKNNDDSESLLSTVKKFRDNIGMQFRLDN